MGHSGRRTAGPPDDGLGSHERTPLASFSIVRSGPRGGRGRQHRSASVQCHCGSSVSSANWRACRPAAYSAVHAVDSPLSSKDAVMIFAASVGGKMMDKTTREPTRFGKGRTGVTRFPPLARTSSRMAICTIAARELALSNDPRRSGICCSHMSAASWLVRKHSIRRGCGC